MVACVFDHVFKDSFPHSRAPALVEMGGALVPGEPQDESRFSSQVPHGAFEPDLVPRPGICEVPHELFRCKLQISAVQSEVIKNSRTGSEAGN